MEISDAAREAGAKIWGLFCSGMTGADWPGKFAEIIQRAIDKEKVGPEEACKMAWSSNAQRIEEIEYLKAEVEEWKEEIIKSAQDWLRKAHGTDTQDLELYQILAKHKEE